LFLLQVIIGCLPSYSHIGVAAPVLLALMRLVQGLAMGGEFGESMMTYKLHSFSFCSSKATSGLKPFKQLIASSVHAAWTAYPTITLRQQYTNLICFKGSNLLGNGLFCCHAHT
jgi:hypothetical protein